MSDEGQSSTAVRDRAAKVLTQCYDGQVLAQPLLEEMQRETAFSSQDVALTAELVLGVLRHRISAEHIAAHFYESRWESLRPQLRVIIALGVYQLCWLDRIPDHAAVDQAVRQAKRHGRGIAGTINALLRELAKHRGPMIPRPEKADPRRFLAVDAHRGREFDVDIFPDPSRQPLKYLTAATGHPPFLVERWHRRFKPALAKQICEAGQRRPHLVLRPNRLRITRDELVRRLSDAGVGSHALGDTDAVVVDDSVTPATLDVMVEGLCQPQDSTAMIALGLAAPVAGEFVVDLCAGIGTKSTQAAELLDNRGVVVAADIDSNKLSRVLESADRLGLTIVRTMSLEQLAEYVAAVNKKPDVLLVDAPCSNTGVLARRPEARYRATHKALIELVALQREILESAVALAGEQTRIVYSTCSIEQEENREQVDWFVERFGWRLERDILTLPDNERDGGYAALLRKGDAASSAAG